MLALFRTVGARYLLMRWPRAALVVVSIALGVATWVATDVLNESLKKSIRAAAMPLAGAADLYITGSNEGVEEALADRLAQVPGVQSVEPLILVNYNVLASVDSKSQTQPAALLGVRVRASEKQTVEDLRAWGVRIPDSDMMSFAIASTLRRLVPPPLAPLYNVPTPALVGDKLSQELLPEAKTYTFKVFGVQVLTYPQFTLRAGGRDHAIWAVGTVKATGPAAMLGGSIVLTDTANASRLLKNPGRVTRMDVKLEPDANLAQVREDITSLLAHTSADVQTPRGAEDRINELIRGFEIAFKLVGAGALVVGLFLVFNAMSVSVAERRHDIGVMRSVGATRSQVRGLFLGESVLLGLAGTLLGIPIGLALAYVARGPIQQIISDLFVPLHDTDMAPTFSMMATAIIFGLGTAMLAALVPASQAAEEEPADAVRRSPPRISFAYRILQVGASFLLIMLGGALITSKSYLTPTSLRITGFSLSAVGAMLAAYPWLGGFRDSSYRMLSVVAGPLLVAGGLSAGLFYDQLPPDRIAYLGLVLVLLGAMLLAPLLASALVRLGQPLFRVTLSLPGRLAADNLVRAGRTGLVIAALAAGVALTVQTAGVLRSNEEPMLEWLDDTITADLMLTSCGKLSASGQTTPMDDRVLSQHLRDAYPDIRLVGIRYRYPDWEGPSGGTKLLLVSIDAGEYAKINRERGLHKATLGLFEQLHEKSGRALISENFAAKNNLHVGETIHFKGSKGPVPFEIMGIVVDYTWNRGTIYIDREANAEAFSPDLVDIYDLYFPPGTDLKKAGDDIAQAPWGMRYSLMPSTRDELRTFARGLIRKIYSMAYTQEIVVGVIAALGVVMALLISVLQRRRELGLLRAVGASKGQVLRSVLAEAVLMGAVGTLIGVVIGLPLEWYVVRVILFDEAGYLFPVRFPWMEAGVISALAVLSATLAGLGPAIGAMRLRIADAIAYE